MSVLTSIPGQFISSASRNHSNESCIIRGKQCPRHPRCPCGSVGSLLSCPQQVSPCPGEHCAFELSYTQAETTELSTQASIPKERQPQDCRAQVIVLTLIQPYPQHTGSHRTAGLHKCVHPCELWQVCIRVCDQQPRQHSGKSPQAVLAPHAFVAESLLACEHASPRI